jgi:hypothetical protein
MTTVNGHHPMGGAMNGTGLHDAVANGIVVNGSEMSETTPSSPAEQPDLLGQRAQLERELAAVRDEVAATRTRVAARDAAMKAALRDELVVSRERLTAMEAEHTEQLAAIRAETQANVERIIADAQRQIGELS